ncbi:MAG: hypothetical protein RR661_01385, partial [Anaerovoracaceae bacterium]
MLKKLFRIAFTFVGGVVGYGIFLLTKYVLQLSKIEIEQVLNQWQLAVAAAVFVIVFAVIFFKLTPTINRQSKKVANNIETDLQHVSTNEIVTGTAGLIIGLMLAFLISNVYNLITVPYLPVILTITTYLLLGYVGVVIATKKGKELLESINSNRRIASVGGKGKGKTKGGDATPKILDTSVIIDGRISDIMKTGFLEGSIVIPEFVLVELRHIADSSDGLKRNRGRRGLDIL